MGKDTAACCCSVWSAKPNEELFQRETKMGKKEWEKQSKEMETIVETVEGGDDRHYETKETVKKTS